MNHSYHREDSNEMTLAQARAALSKMSLPIEVEPAVAEGFRCKVVGGKIGTVNLALLSGDAAIMSSNSSSVPLFDGKRVNLAFQRKGDCLLTQQGRTAKLSPGDFAVFGNQHPYRLAFDGRFEHLILRTTQEFSQLTGDLDKLSARRMSGTSEGVSGLVSALLAEIAHRLPSGVPDSRQFSYGLLSLVAAALCEEEDMNPTNYFETPKRALLSQVKAYIDMQLHDPGLSSVEIAREQAISPRYLQKLFESERTTATEWIRARRLERCSADLIDPHYYSASIATIAARWGLVDSSYFSRIFKATFGVSPREYRIRSLPAENATGLKSVTEPTRH